MMALAVVPGFSPGRACFLLALLLLFGGAYKHQAFAIRNECITANRAEIYAMPQLVSASAMYVSVARKLRLECSVGKMQMFVDA